MQIMGSTARDRGFKGYLTELAMPETGIEYGCRHLQKLLTRYYTVEDALAAYNGGHAAIMKRERSGMYPPDVEKHVDKVMGFYRELTRIEE